MLELASPFYAQLQGDQTCFTPPVPVLTMSAGLWACCDNKLWCSVDSCVAIGVGSDLPYAAKLLAAVGTSIFSASLLFGSWAVESGLQVEVFSDEADALSLSGYVPHNKYNCVLLFVEEIIESTFSLHFHTLVFNLHTLWYLCFLSCIILACTDRAALTTWWFSTFWVAHGSSCLQTILCSTHHFLLFAKNKKWKSFCVQHDQCNHFILNVARLCLFPGILHLS